MASLNQGLVELGQESPELTAAVNDFRNYIASLKDSLPNDATLALVDVQALGAVEMDSWNKYIQILNGFNAETFSTDGTRLSAEAQALANELKKTNEPRFAEWMCNRLNLPAMLSEVSWKIAEKILGNEKTKLKIVT